MAMIVKRSFHPFATLIAPIVIASSILSTRSACAALPTAAIGSCNTPPIIDGKLSPGEWDAATRLAAFSLVGLNKLADVQTACYVCFDAGHIYIAFDCPQDDAPVTGATEAQRDGQVWEDDAVEVFIRKGTSNTYYHFTGNSAGQIADERNRDASWNGEWSYASGLTERGWVAEMAVLATSVGWDGSASEKGLGFNAARDRQSGPAQASSWAPVMRSFHAPLSFGVLMPDADRTRPRLTAGCGPETLGAVLQLINPGDAAAAVRAEVSITGDGVAPSHHVQSHSIPAGKSVRVSNLLPASPGRYTISVNASTNSPDGNETVIAQTWRLVVRPPLEAELRRHFFHDQVVPMCFLPDTPDGRQTAVEFALLDGEKSLSRRMVRPGDPVLPTHDPRDNRAKGRRVSTVLDIADLRPGEYAVRLTSYPPRGAGEQTRLPFRKPEKPAWLDCDYGTEDVLLPPWTPVRVEGKTVSCWGRSYQFDALPTPTQITTQGEQILAAPMRLRCRANGRVVQWRPAGAKVLAHSDTRARLSHGVSGGRIALTGETLVEFDGLVRVDLSIVGRAGDRLEGLALEIPVKKQFATLLFGQPMDKRIGPGHPYPSWSGAANGFIPEAPAAGPFTNYIWLGNDDTGLVWCCESPRNWVNGRPDRAIEVLPRSDRVVLRVNFVDTPVALRNPHDFTFGLQATPVKQMAERKTVQFARWFGAEKKRLVKPDHAWLQYPASGNLNPSHGSAHIWVKVAFDPHGALPKNAPRGDYNQNLFHIDWPNGDRVGLHWNIDDRGLRVYVRDGLPEQNNYLTVLRSRQADWAEGQEHLVTLSWGERLAIYVDGVEVAASAHKGTRPTPLDGTRLLFGGHDGGLQIDAIKVSDREFGGKPMPEPTVEAHTLLLDTFAELDDTGRTRPQKCAAVDGVPQDGVLDARVKTLEGRFATRLDFHVEPQMRSHFDRLAERGVHIVQIHEHWTETQGYPMTRIHQEQLRSFVDGAHEAGLKAILYLGCEIGDNCEEYALYKDEIVVEPWVEGRGYKRQPAQVAYDCAYTGQWQNFMLYHLKQLIEVYDIDGFYLDGSFHTYFDMNQYHGAGYVDADGNLRPSFQIWEYRRWMRRLRTMAEAVKPGLWIDMHDSSAIFTPTNSVGDSVWNGEQYVPVMRALNTTFQGCLTPDAFRAPFLGKQYGFPTDVLAYEHIDEAEAIALVHGVPVRNRQWRPAARAVEGFTATGAEFFPYYANDHRLRVEQKADGGGPIAASFYRRDDGALLLVVANLGRQPAQALLLPQAGITRLPLPTPAVDAMDGSRMGSLDGGIRLELEPWRVRLIRVGPE